MNVPAISPVAMPAFAPASASFALPMAPVQPMCCGTCGCGGKAMALAGASPVDALAALRAGVSELG